MGKFYETIPDRESKWIKEQKVFWVATAPLSGSGHVNISPKGGEYFGVLDEKTFWYMDLTGSGSETISHLIEPGNGRITIQFNAFIGAPKILRLFGKGRVLENGTSDFAEFVAANTVETIPGSRAIIIVEVHQVGTSCGYSVPYFDFNKFRPTLNDHFRKKEEKYQAGDPTEHIERYWAHKNAWSVDNLPSMIRGRETARREGVEPMQKMVGPFAKEDERNVPLSSIRTLLFITSVVAFVFGVLAAPLVRSEIGVPLLQSMSHLPAS